MRLGRFAIPDSAYPGRGRRREKEGEGGRRREKEGERGRKREKEGAGGGEEVVRRW